MAYFGKGYLKLAGSGGQLGKGVETVVVQQPAVLSGLGVALDGKSGGNGKGRRQKAGSQYPDFLFRHENAPFSL